MHRSALLVSAFLAVSACSGSGPRSADSAGPAVVTGHDPVVVQRIIDSAYARLSDAITKGDAQAASALYGDDAILLPMNSKLVRGRNAVDKSLAAMLRTSRFTSMQFKTVDLVLSGDYAIETGSYDVTAQASKGSPVRDVGKYVTVWKRQADGSWKIFRDVGNSDQPAK